MGTGGDGVVESPGQGTGPSLDGVVDLFPDCPEFYNLTYQSYFTATVFRDQ